MRNKRKRTIPELPRERHERTQRLLAERIAYHEARIAARERGEEPATVSVSEADVASLLALHPSKPSAWKEPWR